MQMTKILMLIGVLVALGVVAPTSASAQCYSPGYGGGYYYTNSHGAYYNSHGGNYHYYPSYNHGYYPRSHGHNYYRRRYWH